MDVPPLKRSRVITAESSPNYLSITLSFLSVEQLKYLQAEIPKQIARHLRARLPPSSTSPPLPVATSDWIDIGELTVKDLEDASLLSTLCSQKEYQCPPGNFSFPATNFRGQNKKCSKKLLDQYRELRYSPLKDALYCLPCFVTSAKRLHEANFTDVQFITKGFSNWPDIHARFGSHSNATQKRNTILHSHNVQNLIDLENKWAGKQSVHEQANQEHGTRVQRTKYVLTRIIHLLLTLARQCKERRKKGGGRRRKGKQIIIFSTKKTTFGQSNSPKKILGALAPPRPPALKGRCPFRLPRWGSTPDPGSCAVPVLGHMGAPAFVITTTPTHE